MRTLMFYIIFLFSFFGFLSIGVADNRGTTGADFLKIGLGARSTGMGEAFTARLGDPIVSFYNPAGLAEMALSQVSATHLNWIGDTQYEAVSYVLPILGVGTIGASVFALHMPQIPGLDENGLDTQMLTVYDLGLQLSYARNISPLVGVQGLCAGANLKVLHRELAGLNASGVAADIGAIYEIMEMWTVGLSVLNLGYLSSFDTASEQLPIVTRLGTQYKASLYQDHTLIGALDLVQAFDSTFKANVGLEYNYADTVYLRGGYKIGYDADTFQAGMGVKYQHYALDYALKDMGVFGFTHFITASVGFGNTMKTARLDKVKEILNQTEAEYTNSNYDQALKIVGEAVLIDPKNKRAIHLKEKLNTVLKMLEMPVIPKEEKKDETQKVTPEGLPLTADELEELGETAPEEVQ